MTSELMITPDVKDMLALRDKTVVPKKTTLITLNEAARMRTEAAAMAGVPGVARPFMEDNIALRKENGEVRAALAQMMEVHKEYLAADEWLLPIVVEAFASLEEMADFLDKEELSFESHDVAKTADDLIDRARAVIANMEKGQP